MRYSITLIVKPTHSLDSSGSTYDVQQAHDSIQLAINGIETCREDEQIFKTLYQKMESLKGGPLAMPRRALHQTMRANYHADSPEEFYRLSMFMPYIDHLLTDLRNRFQAAPDIANGKCNIMQINSIMSASNSIHVHERLCVFLMSLSIHIKMYFVYIDE